MKILFLTTLAEDYLSDSVFHGLRCLFGSCVVDYPKAERMYGPLSDDTKSRLYGRGFTLYGLLDSIAIDRSDIDRKLKRRFYDLVIVGNIWRDWQFFRTFRRDLETAKSAVLDGEDSPNIYPFAGKWLRHPLRWFVPRTTHLPYFKRELTGQSIRSTWYNTLPLWVAERYLKVPDRVLPISLSIPAEKLFRGEYRKTTEFGCHVVDPELARHIPGASTSYAFSSECDYYENLRRARFGVTTKRSGWDCMRHYEIAANGAVPCFLRLDEKPRTCAPHGLSEANAIPYENAADLHGKISRLSPATYDDLRIGAVKWAAENTTVERAKQLLAGIKSCARGEFVWT